MEEQLDHMLDTVLSAGPFSRDVKEQAAWVIGDTVIAALYGLASEKEVKQYQQQVAQTTDEQLFPILGTSLKTNKKDNLIIHGTAIVANELDEGNTFAKGHPSAHILPTMLVSAIESDATTDQVLDAYIKAYEIASRLSYASSMRDDMHPHGTWGNAGGAVARALIEGKTKQEIKEIILLSLSLPLSTAWLAAEKGQSVRNLYTGLGSFLAYEAVSYQAYGFASTIGVVENIWSTIMGDGMHPERLTESLMDPPLITQNYFKVHPTCRFTHASIDAAATLINEGVFSHTDIKNVVVDTYSLAARCDVNEPTTKLQSKFSIPYAVACTLMDIDLFKHYEDNMTHVQQLADRIDVQESAEITSLLPGKRAATVHVTTGDGTVHSHTIDNAQGEYTHRFSEETMWTKYENMVVDSYSVDFFHVLKENLLTIDKHDTFKQWLNANELMEG